MKNDSSFLDAFFSCRLEQLTHEDHIRIAWLVLQRHSLWSAIGLLKKGFQEFAEARGKPEIYHETITWSFVVLINERIQRGRQCESWQEFLAIQPDLADSRLALGEFYEPETLRSDLARTQFLLPDRNRTWNQTVNQL